MTRKEKNELKKTLTGLSDKELEKLYYDSVNDTLGSQAEAMQKLNYDISDIVEQEKHEKYLSERLDMIEAECLSRDIKLWKR